jgi:heme/copper-type cytochrome/quinol oxidase subunit 3
LAAATARDDRPASEALGMTADRAERIVGDLGGLPESADGPRSIVWWGNVGFMLIEGTAFTLAAGAYLYLRSESPHWPATGDPLPALLWSGIFTAGLLLSQLPNMWVSKQAKAKDAARVRRGVLSMTIIGIVLLILRGFEISVLAPKWDHDAYSSVLWLLMILHTSHVVTDLGDTAVQAAWLYTHRIGDDQFADVEDNCNYWSFVVVAWVPIYALLYWAPRLT